MAAPVQAHSVGDVLGRFADTGPTRETARAIATLCPAGNRLTARLQADCNNPVGAAFPNNPQVRNALAAITADNATVPIDCSRLSPHADPLADDTLQPAVLGAGGARRRWPAVAGAQRQ
jgi:hypothetical protein